MKSKILSVLLIAVMLFTNACANSVSNEKVVETKEVIKEVEVMVDKNEAKRVTPDEEYYIFELEDSIKREHVYYRLLYNKALLKGSSTRLLYQPLQPPIQKSESP